MAQTKNGDTVRVKYTGRLEDGSVFDSSLDQAPLEFTIGQEEILPAFEQAVVGMSPGEKRTVEIPADHAFGPHHGELVQEIERTSLPEHLDPKVGAQLRATGPKDQTLVLTIIEVKETTVTLDANHPLAGRDLTFEIELLGIA